MAMGLKGREILVPAWTCVVVPHAVVLSGNEPTFIDCGSGSFNMDLDLADKAVTAETGAMISTSIFGEPVNADKLDAFRRRHPEIRIIQDCAHSFNCNWQGRSIPAAGDAAVFGLNISKIMNSIFGGMITTDDEELFLKLRDVRKQVLRPAPWYRAWERRLYYIASTLSLSPLFFGITNKIEKCGILDRFVKYYDDAKIDFPHDWDIGMTGVEAAVGIRQCRRYPEIVARRRENARIYREAFSLLPCVVLPPAPAGATWSHFTMLVPERLREKLVERLEAAGVQIGVLIEYCIPEMRAYAARRPQNPCPVASGNSRRSINLPVWVPARTAEKIAAKFVKIYNRLYSEGGIN